MTFISHLSVRIAAVILVQLLLCGSAVPQDTPIPDFTAGGVIPKGYNHDWNLGPTGARGWIYSHRLETTQARQIFITKVEPDSPAEGILQVNDVITGIGDTDFQFDPRTELGRAITDAESKSGKLLLKLWRDQKHQQVSIPLNVLGAYSATAPFDCPKSSAIFRQGCDALAKRMKENPKAGNGIVQAYNTLALLASGREEFMPIVRQQVKRAAAYSDVDGKSLCCWFYGPTNLLLAEYTLATGDRTHFADLQRITMEIVNGQSQVGSWGHRFARTDGRLNGYGMMNAPGLPMTLSLILARKAGVSDPRLDAAIEKSVRLMRFYVGKGCVPYGDHAPWMETHDDNGKNGIAAVMFNVLEDRSAAEYFSRMSVASHGAEREMGHTGNFFNMLWAMPGVALSGPDATGQWLEEFGWYYDLARKHDGTFPHQGPAEPGTDSYRNWDATGAYLLAYAQPLRKIYITGKKTGVVPQLQIPAAEALIDDGRGYSHRLKNEIYADRSIDQLFQALASWSPIVRRRAALALAKRKQDVTPRLLVMLKQDLYSQLGSCEALAAQKSGSAEVVAALRIALQEDDMWLRIKAAEALAATGKPGRVAIPDLLMMLRRVDQKTDPRAMEQRFLCSALFNSRNGMLRGSLEGVDQDALYQAVRAGLQNEDGRARSEIASVYKQLTYEQIEPLLPTIYRSVVEPAPSGIMFADGIRLAGLQILAQHRIKEALPLCLTVMEMDRWGAARRLPKCLEAINTFGSAATGLVPELQEVLVQKQSKRSPNKNELKQIELLQKTITKIQSDSEPVELRSLDSTSE